MSGNPKGLSEWSPLQIDTIYNDDHCRTYTIVESKFPKMGDVVTIDLCEQW